MELEEIRLPDFWLLWSCSHQNSMILAQKQKYRSMEQNRKLRDKGTTEDEMAGWHHWLDGHEFGWTPGIGDGQGGLSCFNSWGRKESDTPEQLNWIETWKFELNFTWRDIMYWLSGESPCVNILFPSLENLYYRRPLEIKLVILIQNSEI